jgi:hypothetical protein
MNIETLAYMVGAIIATLSLVLLRWLFVHSLLKWLEPSRRADELLRAVLTRAQYRKLMWHCYVDIKSPRDQERIYRVPRYRGRVGLIE